MGQISKEVLLQYPVRALFPEKVQDYSANATKDVLVCFQNHEYPVPNIFEAAACLLPTATNCYSVFGSRTLVISHEGDLEFLKVLKFPPDIFFSLEEPISLVVTRWMEFEDQKDNWVDSSWINKGKKHMTQIFVEPMTLCARATNLFGNESSFQASFRHAYLRERDRRAVWETLMYHCLLLTIATSVQLLPYLVAFIVAIYAFLHGLKIVIILLGTGTAILCLTPLMLTHKNRQLAMAYLRYYFSQSQAIEAKQLIRKKKPLFQAIFFSSLLLCAGSAAIYLMYHYTSMDRELRNLMLRINIGISLSWLAFFFCRSFEMIFSQWSWVIMSYMASKYMEKHMNPLARVKMHGVVTILSGIFSFSLRRWWYSYAT